MSHLGRFLLLAALGPAAGFLAGQAPPREARVMPGRSVVIGPEDTVTIQILDGEELSKAWRVGTSGDLNLPLVGRIQVAGLTVEELERELTKRLRPYIREPQVSVYISEFRSQPVTVMGAVDHPGTLQLQGHRSLFEVLAAAVVSKDAGETVTVTRAKEFGRIPHPEAKDVDGGRYSTVELELKTVAEGHSRAANLPIEARDVVTVSQTRQPRLVHIAGQVMKPGTVELVSQDTVSLMKLLAVAGGLTAAAAPSKTMIMHIGRQGVQTETAFVDLKKITSGRAKDLELGPGDMVFVPNSQLMSYLQATSMSAINTGMYLLAKF